LISKNWNWVVNWIWGFGTKTKPGPSFGTGTRILENKFVFER
jgi:hypothetical protein